MFIANQEYESREKGVALCVFVYEDGSAVFVYGENEKREAKIIYKDFEPALDGFYMGRTNIQYPDASYDIIALHYETREQYFYVDAKSAEEINPKYIVYENEKIYDKPMEGTDKVFEVEITTRVIREVKFE